MALIFNFEFERPKGANVCLATPVKIKSKSSPSKARIEDGRVVDVSMVPDAGVGDWLLCSRNVALHKIPSDEARQILALTEKCEHQK